MWCLKINLSTQKLSTIYNVHLKRLKRRQAVKEKAPVCPVQPVCNETKRNIGTKLEAMICSYTLPTLGSKKFIQQLSEQFNNGSPIAPSEYLKLFKNACVNLKNRGLLPHPLRFLYKPTFNYEITEKELVN